MSPFTGLSAKFEKRNMFLKNSSPYIKSDFQKQSKFSVWRYILSRYVAILQNVYSIYTNRPILYRYQTNHLLGSIILNFLV